MVKSQVFSGRCSGLYATLDPELSLWRTCQLSLFEEDSQLLEVLPPSGITQNGRLFLLGEISGLPISENAGFVCPTPTAKANQLAPDMMRHWRGYLPTPAAHEARLGYQRRPEGKKGKQKSLTTVVIDQMGGREKVTGQLNPEFVEWLMGFPIGHTDLEP